MTRCWTCNNPIRNKTRVGSNYCSKDCEYEFDLISHDETPIIESVSQTKGET